jgi:hypothetical protein
MPVRDPTGPGLALVGALIVLAVGFAALQWRERRHRPADQSPADTAYFARKDAGRLGGSLLMLLVAVAMAVGLRVDPRAGVTQRRVWAVSWLVVMALVLVLLAIALWDWVALRHYARRVRRSLDLERRQAAADLARLRRPPESPTSPPDVI